MPELKENRDLSILPDIFQQFPPVEIVFLFGSLAEGRARQDSDLDLGIEGDPENLKNNVWTC